LGRTTAKEGTIMRDSLFGVGVWGPQKWTAKVMSETMTHTRLNHLEVAVLVYK